MKQYHGQFTRMSECSTLYFLIVLLQGSFAAVPWFTILPIHTIFPLFFYLIDSLKSLDALPQIAPNLLSVSHIECPTSLMPYRFSNIL